MLNLSAFFELLFDREGKISAEFIEQLAAGALGKIEHACSGINEAAHRLMAVAKQSLSQR